MNFKIKNNSDLFIIFADDEMNVKVNDHEFIEKIKPTSVNYISFGSWKGSPLHVYFNCTTQEPPKQLTLIDLITETYESRKLSN